MSYRTLNAAEIVNTIRTLEQRIYIEELTANFSRKVWQKISIREPTTPSSAAPRQQKAGEYEPCDTIAVPKPLPSTL